MKYSKFDWQTVLYVLLCVLLPVLAIYQYNQIGELSFREKENLKNNLEVSAFQYSFMVSKELYDMQSAFYIRDSSLSSSYVFEFVKERLKNIRSGRFSERYDSVFIVSTEAGNFDFYSLNEKTGFYNKLTNPDTNLLTELKVRDFRDDSEVHFPNMILRDLSYLTIPLIDQSGKRYCVVVKLNKPKFIEEVIDKNFRIYFPAYGEFKIIIAIKDKDDKFIYTNHENNVEPKNQHYELIIPFGMIPPLDGPPPGGDRKFDSFKDGPPPGGDRKFDSFKDRDGKRFAKALFGSRKHFRKPHIFENMLKLHVGFKDGDLNDKIAYIRIRNLVISFSILLLLGIVIILIAYNSSKTKKLVEQRLQFMAGISHDLRTPVTVIKSAGQNLADGIVNDSERAKIYGGMIIKETNKLWEMIETALSFAGIQANLQALSLKNEVLIDLIEQSIKENPVIKPEHIINIENNIGKCEIECDRKSLFSAFQNIINNSIKFSPEKVIINIKLDFSSNNKNVVVEFSDKGIGIAKKDLKNIFKPFYRSKSAIDRNVHGNGVGLSIVKNAASLHSGSVKAESILGEGTKIMFIIPGKSNEK